MEPETRADARGQRAEGPANRAALLTPPGAAAIAVVRLVGPKVAEFIARHFSKPVPPLRCVHGQLRDDDRIIDDPVIVFDPSAESLDINLHGGEWVVRQCLELAARAGFEIGEPSADCKNEIEAEMLAALPQATTELAIRMLLAQPKAWVQMGSDLGTIRDMITDRSLWWMLHPPRVAIVGATNVGKSTLANQLFGMERSITADLPGTTRDYVGDLAHIDGVPIHLLDTPGQRSSADPIERAAIALSRREIEQADLVIVVLDVTRPIEPEQTAILAQYPDALVVANKSDLPATWDSASLNAVQTVATRGEGIRTLRDRIRARFGCTDLSIERPRCWTQRQRDALAARLASAP